MAGNLTDKTPSQSYKDLIQIDNSNQGIDSSYSRVVDGLGVNTPILISSSGISIESGIIFKDVEITCSPDEINTLARSYPIGSVQPSKVVVSDSNSNIQTSGGSIDFTSNSVYSSYGSISNLELGPHSQTLVRHSGLFVTTSINLDPASGNIHHIILRNSKSEISISNSRQMSVDNSSANLPAYYLKLFFEQGYGAPHEWAWSDAENIKWEPTYPSGYGPSGSITVYTSGIPLIHDEYAIYSGGIRGGHRPLVGEIDIVEMWSLDLGSSWYARRVASGII